MIDLQNSSVSSYLCEGRVPGMDRLKSVHESQLAWRGENGAQLLSSSGKDCDRQISLYSKWDQEESDLETTADVILHRNCK